MCVFARMNEYFDEVNIEVTFNKTVMSCLNLHTFFAISTARTLYLVHFTLNVRKLCTYTYYFGIENELVFYFF